MFQAWVGPPAPRFVERCMATTADWARARGFDYRRLGDDFLDVLPGWYRDRLAAHIVQQTNLARLRYACELLAAGAGRVVWVDADVLVFDPERLALDAPEGFALCREVWVQPSGHVVHGVSQAVLVADRGTPLLDYLAWAHEALVRDRPERVVRFGTATSVLSGIHAAVRLPVVTGVGMMNPTMLCEIGAGRTGPVTCAYVRAHGFAMHAVNLTLSMLGVQYGDTVATEADYEAALDVLVATRGAPLDLARSRAARA